MATVKFQKDAGGWNVYRDGERIGRVRRARWSDRVGVEPIGAWVAEPVHDTTGALRQFFGRRRSAAAWLVRQAEREPMHRGGAK